MGFMLSLRENNPHLYLGLWTLMTFLGYEVTSFVLANWLRGIVVSGLIAVVYCAINYEARIQHQRCVYVGQSLP